jgi:hypothetical protein
MDMYKDARPTSANSDYKGRIIYWQTKAILFAFSVLSCAVASDSFAESRDNVLATLQLADGSIVQFNETAPGQLVVLKQTRATHDGQPTVAIGGVSIAVLDGLDPVGQYEALSGGAAAPPALIQAQARVESTMRTDAAPADKAVNRVKAPAKDNSIQPELTGDEFRSTYCPNSRYNFYFCWLYRTGTSWVQRASASYLQSTVHPYRGNVQQHVEYYADGYWHTINSKSVLEGWISWMTIYGGSYPSKRATIDEADGDGYHVAYFGRN